MKIKILILLVIMIITSFFSGIPINKNWNFVYQFEFIDFPEIMMKYETSFREIPSWIIVLLAHIGIISLPFLIHKAYFKKALLYFPLAYLLGYVILRIEFVFVLIPFILLWLVTLSVAKGKNNV